MLTNANVAKAGMQKKEKSLAELVSGNPQTLCSQRLETQVSEIRASSNWLQRIVRRSQKSQWQKNINYTEVAYRENEEHELQNICTVASRADSQDSLNEHSEISLLSRFGSTDTREHLYPVDSLEAMPAYENRPRLKFLMLVAHAAMIGYLLLLWQQLRDHMSESFAWHPILMSVALVMSTEGIVIMQYAPWPVPHNQTQNSRKFHYFMHIIAGILQAAGIVQCILSVARDTHEQEANAAHKVVGTIGGIAFIVQLMFGVCLVTRARKQRKLWYKHHRAIGYGVLVVQWTSAWLGVHSKWIQGKRAPSEWLWLVCFALLMVSVLVPVDLAKFGFRHRP
ncbi:hypothetical protein IWW36_001564 [Coemansia brasiliensis]|uniref:Cytochrome b561 domain-containing protein n=1 Tax=Coemansia brasiliensis TaxID=2650707 RepID=A0A9W8I8M8_9FUNG|nr:hypothetical protein IWW36_001564 [Coemansia brasiliensis]